MEQERQVSPLDEIEISESVAVIPKADLHLHAEAGPCLERILAKLEGWKSTDWREWARDLMRSTAPGMDRLNRLSKQLITPEQDAEPANFLARVENVLQSSASADAVYVEVRFGRETIMRPDFMEQFRRAESAVEARYPGFVAEPLATLIPQRDPERTEVLVNSCVAAVKDGLSGVDIIPDPYSEEAEWEQTYRWAERLAASGLQITVHAGEFSTANVASALKVPGARRIGHGIQIAGNPDLVEAVKDSGVALECCITSNVVLGAVESYEAHPLALLANAEVPVTINTDNPVQFSTSIAREYEIAHRLGLDTESLTNVTQTAIKYAFTTPQRRALLLTQSSVSEEF